MFSESATIFRLRMNEISLRRKLSLNIRLRLGQDFVSRGEQVHVIDSELNCTECPSGRDDILIENLVHAYGWGRSKSIAISCMKTTSERFMLLSLAAVYIMPNLDAFGALICAHNLFPTSSLRTRRSVFSKLYICASSTSLFLLIRLKSLHIAIAF